MRSKFHRLNWAVCVVTTFATLAIAPAARSQPAAAPLSSSEANHVRDLLVRGTAALSADKPEEARTLLAEAYSIRRSYDVAAALGQAELELGRYRDAAEHLDYCLREFPPSESQKLLSLVQGGLATAKAKVATARISVNPADSELTVDGRSIGSALPAHDVFVEPGSHRIGAHHPNGNATEKLVTFSAGESYAISLELGKLPPAAVALAPPPQPPSPTPTSEEAATPASGVTTKTILLIGGTTITAALIGVGIVERLRGGDAGDAAQTLKDETHGNCTDASTDEKCLALASELDKRNSANQLAIYSFVGAGVTGAATVALWFLLPEPKKSAAINRQSVALSITPHAASISLTKHF
jgi:tetratricopeptide (TPR) repeat protein